jgi:hypothetical protein
MILNMPPYVIETEKEPLIFSFNTAISDDFLRGGNILIHVSLECGFL